MVGTFVHDSATLTGATDNAGGTATYTVYTNNTCTAGAQDAGTVEVSGTDVDNSHDVQFNTAGDFYWQVVYSGDADNNGADEPVQLRGQRASARRQPVDLDHEEPEVAVVHDGRHGDASRSR